MDSNHRPPGYEPGQLPLLTLCDIAIHHFKETLCSCFLMQRSAIKTTWASKKHKQALSIWKISNLLPKTDNAENKRRGCTDYDHILSRNFCTYPKFQYLCIYLKLFKHENRRNLSYLHPYPTLSLLLFRLYGRAWNVLGLPGVWCCSRQRIVHRKSMKNTYLVAI